MAAGANEKIDTLEKDTFENKTWELQTAIKIEMDYEFSVKIIQENADRLIKKYMLKR